MDLNTLAVRSDTSHFLVNHRVFPIEFHTPLARYEHLRLATTRDGQWVLYWRRLSSAFAIKTTRRSCHKYLRCSVFRDSTSACSLRRISWAISVFFTSNVTSFIVVFTSNFARHHRVLHVECHVLHCGLNVEFRAPSSCSSRRIFTRHHYVFHVEFHAP